MIYIPGDLVRVKENVWYRGTDIGKKLGEVLSHKSYVMVAIDGYSDPIKLMQHEVERIDKLEELFSEFDDEVFANLIFSD